MSSEFVAPESGNGNVGPLGWLAPLVAGLAGTKQAAQDRSEHRQDRAELQRQDALKDVSGQLANQQTQQQISDAQLAHTVQENTQTVARGGTALDAAFANPALASDPTIIATIRASNAAQGLPTQFNPDGTLNLNAQRKPLTELDPKQLSYVQSADVGPRKPLLDQLKRQGYDIPDSMYTDSDYVTQKDKAEFQKNQNIFIHNTDQNAWEIKRNNLRQYVDSLEAPAKAQYLANLSMTNGTKAKAIMIEARARAQQAQAYTQRVGGELKKWQQNPAGNTATVRALLSGSSQNLGQLNTALNDARKDVTTLSNNQISSDDPTYQAAIQSVNDLQNQVGLAEQADAQLRSSITGNPNVGASAGAAAGIPVTNTSGGAKIPQGYSSAGAAPAGVKDGATNQDAYYDYLVQGGVVYRKLKQ